MERDEKEAEKNAEEDNVDSFKINFRQAGHDDDTEMMNNFGDMIDEMDR